MSPFDSRPNLFGVMFIFFIGMFSFGRLEFLLGFNSRYKRHIKHYLAFQSIYQPKRRSRTRK
jgi:hypothetical protein